MINIISVGFIFCLASFCCGCGFTLHPATAPSRGSDRKGFALTCYGLALLLTVVALMCAALR